MLFLNLLVLLMESSKVLFYLHCFTLCLDNLIAELEVMVAGFA